MKDLFIATVYEEVLAGILKELDNRDDLPSDALEDHVVYKLTHLKNRMSIQVDKVLTQPDADSRAEMLEDLEELGCYITTSIVGCANNKQVEVKVRTNKGTFYYVGNPERLLREELVRWHS